MFRCYRCFTPCLHFHADVNFDVKFVKTVRFGEVCFLPSPGRFFAGFGGCRVIAGVSGVGLSEGIYASISGGMRRRDRGRWPDGSCAPSERVVGAHERCRCERTGWREYCLCNK